MRRAVFVMLIATACAGPRRGPATVGTTPEPMAPPATAPGDREQTADQQVAQVLSRLTFGARPGDAERVRAMGVDAWIDQQLHPERIDDEIGRASCRERV